MDPILTPLIPLLNGLGPWGIPAGIALTLLVQWARRRLKTPLPHDPLAPAPVTPAEPRFPLLNALLELLRRNNPNLPAVPVEVLAALRGEIDGMVSEHREQLRGYLTKIEALTPVSTLRE